MSREISVSNLKRFYRNIMRNSSPVISGKNYDRMPVLELESHLTINRYGTFQLTEAVRPSLDLTVIPEQGYRVSSFRDSSCRTIPLLMISVSAEKLFDTFLDLLKPLGDCVNAVLETSHWQRRCRHQDFERDEIDMPVLQSFLCQHEELLLNDGCTGIAVVNPEQEIEVQLDEHKLLFVYADHLRLFEHILKQNGITRNDTLRFLTEAEHIHTTRETYIQEFLQLRSDLGIDC